MKRLTVLTLVAIAMMSLSGCSRGWPRWLCRGDACSGGMFDTPCETGAMVDGTLLPPSSSFPTELPGPVRGQPTL